MAGNRHATPRAAGDRGTANMHGGRAARGCVDCLFFDQNDPLDGFSRPPYITRIVAI